jgi:hypothetical protein
MLVRIDLTNKKYQEWSFKSTYDNPPSTYDKMIKMIPMINGTNLTNRKSDKTMLVRHLSFYLFIILNSF